MSNIETLTYDEVSELLFYNPNDGTFFHKERKETHIKLEKARNSWNTKYAGKKAGTLDDRGYLKITLFNKHYWGHRLAILLMTGFYPKEYVDHIDGDRSNNKYSNLRCATNAQNVANSGLFSHNTSGFKGVSWDKTRNKWQAKIKIKGITKNLGRFSTAEEACRIYLMKAKELHGEFVR